MYIGVRIGILIVIFALTLGLLWYSKHTYVYPWVRESIRDPNSPNGIQSVLDRIFPT